MAVQHVEAMRDATLLGAAEGLFYCAKDSILCDSCDGSLTPMGEAIKRSIPDSEEEIIILWLTLKTAVEQLEATIAVKGVRAMWEQLDTINSVRRAGGKQDYSGVPEPVINKILAMPKAAGNGNGNGHHNGHNGHGEGA